MNTVKYLLFSFLFENQPQMYFLKVVLIFLKSLVTEKETETDRDLPPRLVYSPDGCNSLKPGTKNFFQVSYLSAGAQHLVHSPLLSQAQQQEGGSQSKQLELELPFMLDAGATNGGFISSATTLAQKYLSSTSVFSKYPQQPDLV